MRRNFVNKLLAVAGLALLSIGSAEAQLRQNVLVDLALYRPSTGQFFIRSSLNGSVTAIPFGGAPGDRGLLCKWHSNPISGGDNLLLFRNGIWFVSLAGDGATEDFTLAYGNPDDQPLCGSYGRFGQSDLGLFRNGVWFVNNDGSPTFFFGQAGDVAVHIGVKGWGNKTDRQNMIYGVYRAGIWYIDETGSGTPSRAVGFGGEIQDVPLLIPHWWGAGLYSLAIYRDGIWHIQIQPFDGGLPVVTVAFGAPGDIPLVRGAH